MIGSFFVGFTYLSLGELTIQHAKDWLIGYDGGFDEV